MTLSHKKEYITDTCNKWMNSICFTLSESSQTPKAYSFIYMMFLDIGEFTGTENKLAVAGGYRIR